MLRPTQFNQSILSSPAIALSHTKFPALSKSSNAKLVIIHGLFGSKRNWRTMAKNFSQKLNVEVFTLDLRNHGDSPHSSVFNYSAMAKDVEEFIEKNKLENVTLLGHSMGGKVAMTVALRQQSPLSRLVVVDSAPMRLGLSLDFAKFLERMKEIEKLQLTQQSQADILLRDIAQDLSVRQFLLTNLRWDNSKKQYRFQIPLDILHDSLNEVREFPYMPGEASYARPTLFIAGRRSRHRVDEKHHLLKRFFPQSRVSALDTGHWVQVEKPDEFFHVVADFIENT
ncbi:uncharacterized protein VTP21DRAFT_2120 [Calcarisporiella thermophila]|uniref:uncharacterized protein n=1 Tax=Calcarisporiella thermophila TaxID=911321 RepID=UPI0037449AE4